MTKTAKAIFKAQTAAIILMAAGWGWLCGNFVQPLTPWYGSFADILHILPYVALLLLSLPFFSASVEGKHVSGVRAGISIVAILGIILCVVFIILGATNPDPNSVGVHSIQDWMVVIVLNAGTILWLLMLPFSRRGATTARLASNQ